jgi:glycosyltransferase involved in cell wall biosynthesis
MPKVSIVIPTFNRPERLRQALLSVVRQTVGDFEVFVVDDGSRDGTALNVVEAFEDTRLHCIRLPISRGPGAARNAGLARASAPYIAFLDDDDEWLPEKLEVQLGILETCAETVGGVYSARITVDEVAATTAVTRFAQKKFDIDKGNIAITTSSILLRRESLDAVGLFDETLFSGQDFDMWIRLAQVCDLVYVDRPLIKYFIHHGYRITDDDARKAEAQELLFKKHRRLFEANRRAFCLMYVGLGLRYRRLGDGARGRRALYKALRLWPLEPRVYWAFIRPVVRRNDYSRPAGSGQPREPYSRHEGLMSCGAECILSDGTERSSVIDRPRS